jgi:hypothetical protein
VVNLPSFLLWENLTEGAASDSLPCDASRKKRIVPLYKREQTHLASLFISSTPAASLATHSDVASLIFSLSHDRLREQRGRCRAPPSVAAGRLLPSAAKGGVHGEQRASPPPSATAGRPLPSATTGSSAQGHRRAPLRRGIAGVVAASTATPRGSMGGCYRCLGGGV